MGRAALRLLATVFWLGAVFGLFLEFFNYGRGSHRTLAEHVFAGGMILGGAAGWFLCAREHRRMVTAELEDEDRREKLRNKLSAFQKWSAGRKQKKQTGESAGQTGGPPP